MVHHVRGLRQRVRGGRIASYLIAAAMLATALAVAGPTSEAAPAPPLSYFKEVATYATPGGGAEIVAANTNGDRFIYTDSPAEEVGIVSLVDPTNPSQIATVPMPGEPTSVALTASGLFAAVAVNNPAGSSIQVVRMSDGYLLRSIPIDGQPDSVAIDHNGGKYLVVAIENELTPAVPGKVAVIDMPVPNSVNTWTAPVYVEMTGLADINPDDPEPEYVDVKGNFAAVTLQENNHIVIVRLPTKTVHNDFSAGFTTQRADTIEDGEISFTDEIVDSPNMPDAIQFHPKGYLVHADEGEGDFTGGRGFTIRNFNGTLKSHKSDAEITAAQYGHYDDGRSANRGAEFEGGEIGFMNGRIYWFVASERGDFVSVYQLPNSGVPTLHQVLPTGDAPEGLVAMSQSELFLTANEADGTVTVFQAVTEPLDYPDTISLRSVPVPGDPSGIGDPIPWGAISGLAAGTGDTAYAVHDNALTDSRIYTIDTSLDPLLITDQLFVTTPFGAPYTGDLEGITTRKNLADDIDPSLGWWVVSEGAASVPTNQLLYVQPNGVIGQTVELPPAVVAQQRQWGFEGVSSTGSGANEQVYVVFQREWADDPLGYTRIGRYTPATGEWAFFHYALDEGNPGGLTNGLSEIVHLGDQKFAVIERDSLSGDDAGRKLIYGIDLEGVTPTPCGPGDGSCPVDPSAIFPGKVLLEDLLTDFDFDFEKVEGLSVREDGQALVINDNDGAGETRVLRIDSSPWNGLFPILP